MEVVRREIYNLKIKSFVWPHLLASDSGSERSSAPEKEEKPLLGERCHCYGDSHESNGVGLGVPSPPGDP